MAYRVMACFGTSSVSHQRMRLFSKGCTRVTGKPEVNFPIADNPDAERFSRGDPLVPNKELVNSKCFLGVA
jgi:hypothetical protein